MEVLTRAQAIKEWKDMWNWIADESEKRGEVLTRRDYLSETGAKYKNPLCKAAIGDNGKIDCNLCPARWQWEFGDIRYSLLRKIQIRPQRCETCQKESDSFFNQARIVELYSAEMRTTMIGLDKYILLVRALANAIA